METLQRTANRGSISTDTSFQVDNSLKTDEHAGEYFYRNSPTAGNKRTFTFSFRIKRTQLTGYVADPYLMSQGSNQRFHFAGDSLRFMFDGNSTELEASGRLRDTSAWYHVVLAVDTTQSTAANRVKAYLNGQDYPWNNTKYPSQNSESGWMSGSSMYFNTRDGDGAYHNSAYWAEVVVIDGQQLSATDFGEFDSDTGIWKPKNVSGLNFGNEGFYLNFQDSSDLGADVSGNNNDCTLNNIAAADQSTDTCTNNFCTINVINLSTQTLTEGATKIVSTDNTSRTSFGTMAVSKGKWWWEGKIQVYESADSYPCIGVTGDLDNPPATSAQLWKGNHVVVLAKAQKWVTNDTGYSYGTAYADNDIINIALDMDNHIMYTYKNGTIDDASGINFSSQSAATADDFYIPINLVYVTGGGSSWEMNFGGFANYTISSGATDDNGYGTFEYAPPSGYYALCTKNLEEYG